MLGIDEAISFTDSVEEAYDVWVMSFIKDGYRHAWVNRVDEKVVFPGDCGRVELESSGYERSFVKFEDKNGQVHMKSYSVDMISAGASLDEAFYEREGDALLVDKAGKLVDYYDAKDIGFFSEEATIH